MFACKSAWVYFLRKFWVTDVPCLQHNVKLLELHKQKHAMRYGCARCPLSFSGGEESLIQVSAIFQVLVIAFKASPHYFFKQSTLCFLSKRLKAQLLCLDAPTFFPLYFLLIKKTNKFGRADNGCFYGASLSSSVSCEREGCYQVCRARHGSSHAGGCALHWSEVCAHVNSYKNTGVLTR